MPLFQGLAERDQAELADQAFIRRFDPEEMIFRQGDEVTRFHVLMEGGVKLFRSTSEGKEQTLYVVDPGEPFCLCTIYNNRVAPLNARAIAASRVMSLPGDVMEKHSHGTPLLLLNILRVLNTRLLSSMQMIEDLALRDVQQRTASFLRHTLLAQGDDADRVSLRVPRHEVARILGTTPESISRVLARMTQQGMIRAQGRDIAILDREALDRMAG
ncbi:CRP/FNR family transcriptional regulator, anaerobic regulatory protein [Paucidesulfovibrio gracilis DSM 16080]|uniref:CRP/FNR family transcriptional regulator, anaerobic regulatory protein n=2 Tax=Paucidesulfovibrio TaxID=2910985 RepID=A0A1T4XRN7_9BACT|nr:CRP/FNR family transcriptional regulator, anaerobic regulatory protein [Paucidesulfovibrio gracilis DSM 16080]